MEGDIVTLQDLFVTRAAEQRATESTLLGPLRSTGLRPGFLPSSPPTASSSGVDLAGGGMSRVRPPLLASRLRCRAGRPRGVRRGAIRQVDVTGSRSCA